MMRQLQKVVEEETQADNELNSAAASPEMQQLLQRVKDKPFWIFSKPHERKHDIHSGNCCFNHIIGLPLRRGEPQPLWDYQDVFLRAIEIDSYLNSSMNYGPAPDSVTEKGARAKSKLQSIYSKNKIKHLACLKSTGLGISELVLRYIAFLCVSNDKYKDTQMIIFTGPRLELAVSLIRRLKELFRPFNIQFDDKETVLNLNGVRIEAYPSHHSATARGLPNVSLIFIDEASFIPQKEIQSIMDICLRNVPKSDPILIVVSTPNRPGDFMDLLMKEPFETSPFKKIYLDWTYGINKIYSQEDIEKIKNSRSFQREYCLKFLPETGNVFLQSAIDRAVELGRKYLPSLDNVNKNAKHIIGIDPGFSNRSQFGIVVLEHSDSIIKVLYADSLPRDSTSYEDMVHKLWSLRNQIGLLTNVYIDYANIPFITSAKQVLGDITDWKYIEGMLNYCNKTQGVNIETRMIVVPVAFGAHGAEMLINAKSIVEDPNELIAINPNQEKLIAALRSAIAEEYRLVKTSEGGVYSDIMDAFRLALKYFNVNRKKEVS
jgi:hypothetical protein